MAVEEISPESMKTPHEPDATYRKKSGKGNVGYSGNKVEAFDGEKILKTGYDLQKNTYSDAQFCSDVLYTIPDHGETETIIIDRAYVSTDTLETAERKSIGIVTTLLIGGMQGTFEAKLKPTTRERLPNTWKSIVPTRRNVVRRAIWCTLTPRSAWIARKVTKAPACSRRER